MGLTTIGDQKTPGRPVQITFAPQTGIPSANQTLVLFGHAASGATGINTVVTINNAGDPVAGGAEAATKFGSGSELTKMVIAAINAIAESGNLANFATLKCVPLLSSDTGFGGGAALAALNKIEAEYIVSPYDGQTDMTNTNAIKNQAASMSGPQNVQNSQFGTFAVVCNQSVSDPSTLFAYDTQYLVPMWFRNSAPTMSNGELAAAYAAVMAGNLIPFNPLDGQVVGGLVPPASISDYETIGANAESETALNLGWGPMKVLPNGTVAIVRTITARITVGDAVTKVSAYYDAQDFSVLYYWRKTVFTRFNQPDFSQVKASQAKAQDAKSELIRLATTFQDQNMFQAVDQLAKQFQVQRSLTDRSRFDVLTPVNVIPGLHVIATNVQAGTQFDAFTV
jgi:phage tail sheath gpL-like